MRHTERELSRRHMSAVNLSRALAEEADRLDRLSLDKQGGRLRAAAALAEAAARELEAQRLAHRVQHPGGDHDDR